MSQACWRLVGGMNTLVLYWPVASAVGSLATDETGPAGLCRQLTKLLPQRSHTAFCTVGHFAPWAIVTEESDGYFTSDGLRCVS